MANVKISQLPAASTPLAGSEEIPLVQGGITKQVTVNGLLTSANLGTPSVINLTYATNVPVNEATGVLPVVNGGTGAATAAAGIQNLLPSYSGNASKRLGLNSGATALEWVADGSGTVTSVGVSVPAFLSVSNSPITASGTIALSYSGVALPVLNGGTGQTTANAAFNALVPSQTGNSGKYLTTNGTDTSWGTNPLGDVVGPASSTDNAVARFDSTTGKLLQDSVVLIGDTGAVTGVTDLTASGTLGVTGVATLGAGAILNTPASVTLTNATGLPIATGVSGLGTGVATFLATPSSANLLAAVTDETGTGSLVFATSPTLVTPALGTPSSGVVTNLTGTASININGTVGATTPNTGNFTTLGTTGNVTLGDATTDTVTVNGYMGVGGAATASVGVYVTNSALTNTNQHGVLSTPTGTSAATAFVSAFSSAPATAATAFTSTDVMGFRSSNATKGAGSTITNLHGLYIVDQTQGTNNYGITSLVSSGTNKFNVYASGTASNYFAGNVGIGVTTPSYKLHSVSTGNGINSRFTNGTTIVDIVTSSSTSFVGDAGGNNAIGFNTASNYVALYTTATTEGMRLTSTGLGIGTTSPTNKLVVSAAGAQGIEFNPANTATLNEILSYNRSGAAYNTLQYRAADHRFLVSLTQAMTLDSAGNLALGRTTATYRADVDGNFRFANTSAGVLTGFFGCNDTGSITLNFGGTTTPTKGRILYSDNADIFAFYTNSTERMRIDSTGNVGIGTTLPSSFLYNGLTVGGGTGNIGLTLFSSTTGIGSIAFADSSSGTARYVGHFRFLHTSNSFTFDIADVEKMRLTSTGLGIGTTSPNASALLDVQSTTQGVRMPNMTTTEKNAIASPAAGLMVFDTTLAKLCVYSGSAWQTITSV